MEIWFSNPHYLWLLIPIPMFAAIMFVFLIRGKRDIEKFISFRALEFIFKKGGFMSRYIKKNFLGFMFRTAIYMIIIIAGYTIYYDGIAKDQSMVVAIDASGSMLAEDIKPNRLEAVKETIKVFLEKISPESRVAVISFSGNAYIEQGWSNKDDAIKSIENIEISPIAGTSIGTALKTAISLLSKEKNPKVVVLLSDGGENVIPQKELDEIIDNVDKEHIAVEVIGVGAVEGMKLGGTELPSAIDEPLLENIAKKTDGIYVRAETKPTLTEAYERIIPAKIKIPVRLRFPLIMLCILLLLIDYIFIGTD